MIEQGFRYNQEQSDPAATRPNSAAAIFCDGAPEWLKETAARVCSESTDAMKGDFFRRIVRKGIPKRKKKGSRSRDGH